MNKFLSFICVILICSIPFTCFADEVYTYDAEGQYSPRSLSTSDFTLQLDVFNVSLTDGFSNFSQSDIDYITDFLEGCYFLSYNNSDWYSSTNQYNIGGYAFLSSTGQVLVLIGSSALYNPVRFDSENNTFTIDRAGAISDAQGKNVHGYWVGSLSDVSSGDYLCCLKDVPSFPYGDYPFGCDTESEMAGWDSSVSSCEQSWNQEISAATYNLNTLSGTHSFSDYVSGNVQPVAACWYSPTWTASQSSISNFRSSAITQTTPYYTLNQQTQNMFSQILAAVQNIPQDLADVLDDIFDSLNDGTESLIGAVTNMRDDLGDYVAFMMGVNNDFNEDLFNFFSLQFSQLRSSITGVNNTLKTGFTALGRFFDGFSFSNWNNSNNSFTITDRLHEVIVNAYNDVNNELNPLSEDNEQLFNQTIDSFQNDTFIGSGMQVVDGVSSISSALQQSGTSSVLTVNTLPVHFAGGVDIPSKPIKIDISWLGANATFYSYYRTLIGAFIIIAWFILFGKRLPGLISGASMDTFSYQDSVSEDITVDDNGVVTKWTTTTRSGGVTTRQKHDV